MTFVPPYNSIHGATQRLRATEPHVGVLKVSYPACTELIRTENVRQTGFVSNRCESRLLRNRANGCEITVDGLDIGFEVVQRQEPLESLNSFARKDLQRSSRR